MDIAKLISDCVIKITFIISGMILGLYGHLGSMIVFLLLSFLTNDFFHNVKLFFGSIFKENYDKYFEE